MVDAVWASLNVGIAECQGHLTYVVDSFNVILDLPTTTWMELGLIWTGASIAAEYFAG